MPNRSSMIPISVVLDENGKPKLPFGYHVGPGPFPTPGWPPRLTNSAPLAHRANPGHPNSMPGFPFNPMYPMPSPNFAMGYAGVPACNMSGFSEAPFRAPHHAMPLQGAMRDAESWVPLTKSVPVSLEISVPETAEEMKPLWKPKPECRPEQMDQSIDLAESEAEDGLDDEERLGESRMGPIFTNGETRNAGGKSMSSESEWSEDGELQRSFWSSEEEEGGGEEKAGRRKSTDPSFPHPSSPHSSVEEEGLSQSPQEKPPTPGLRRSTRKRKPTIPLKSVRAQESKCHDREGRLRVNKRYLDICDCLSHSCTGCHFPCKKCDSQKCGIHCRRNRAFAYRSVYEYGRGKIRTV